MSINRRYNTWGLPQSSVNNMEDNEGFTEFDVPGYQI
jgi:hypothetical protein